MDNNPILIYFCRALFPRPCQLLPTALQRFDEEVIVAGCGKRESFGAGSVSQDSVIGRSAQSEPSLRGREGEFATWTMTQLIMGANAGKKSGGTWFLRVNSSTRQILPDKNEMLEHRLWLGTVSSRNNQRLQLFCLWSDWHWCLQVFWASALFTKKNIPMKLFT